MRSRGSNPFTTVRTEGGLLPVDLLQRVAEADARLGGLSPEAYHLSGEKVGEAVSRSWQRLLGAWRAFRSAADKLSESDAGTSVTREKWLLPLFHELGYGRLVGRGTVEVDGVSYPVSHAWEHAPIHLLGFRVELDRRTAGVAGAARTSPHGLVQEVLNRSDAHLWGFLSNGHRLRILRDSVSLARPAYVEWDLEAMMEGEVYPDFVLLWLLCHQSRVEAARPEECWLERWARAAQEQGTRVLEDLRLGVEHAINALGTGFLAHRENAVLRDRLRTGELDRQEYYRQLLRVVYRMLFLFVAEDRGLLLDPAAPAEARERYTRWYSTARLRRLAERRTGTRHGDLLQGLWLVMRKLGEKSGCPELGLPALGSFLFSLEAAAALEGLAIDNRHLLDALRALAFTADRHRLRPVDFRNLGSRELGSVYESLLELHPELNVDAGTFVLRTVSGSERKTTGSYYTPESLIQALLDSALDPVLDQAARSADPAAAILALRVCDPACGSGHFLISAAHRIAQRLAAARSPDEEPSLEVQRHALRDVIGHCVYGVDLNPMAVELCKVSLWMEALEPGRPLSFLDHRIQVGNSLLGTTPALLRAGIPDDAFTPIEGDDRKLCAEFKKQNKRERLSEQIGFFVEMGGGASNELSEAMRTVDELPDETFDDVQRKQAAYADLVRSGGYGRFRRLADAWCAAFVWKKTKDFPYAITEEVFRRIERNPDHLPGWMRDEIDRLREQYQFFHWHLAFPDVFRVPERPEVRENDPTGWEGGFDVVLGNPPWETMSPDLKEFFSVFDPEIRNQSPARQRDIVERLLTDSSIQVRWEQYRRQLFGAVHLIKESGRYVLFAPGNLGKGDFNTYRFFVETALRATRDEGMVGQIVPDGFYSGANTMAIREELFSRWDLRVIWGFENTREVWFEGIDSRAKFALYAARNGGSTSAFSASFNIRSVEQLAAVQNGGDLKLPVVTVKEFSEEAMAVMEFHNQVDIDIATKMYERWPKFGDEHADGPIRRYMRELDMGTDRGLFSEDPSGLPLYEGRMVAQYDHRAKAYRAGRGRTAEWEDLPFGYQTKSICPQWRVPVELVPEKTSDRAFQYRIGFCDVASPTNERTLVATLLPPGVLAGHIVPTITFTRDNEWAYLIWIAVANSYAMDFLARKKVTLHMTFAVVDSLPFPRMSFDDSRVPFLAERVLLLTCTGPEMIGFWNEMAKLHVVAPIYSADEVPGLLDEEQRLIASAEIEAFLALSVYGLSRSELSHILDTFPIVEKRDRKVFGEYRTKRVILEIFDEMAEAARTGTSYRTRLDLPPADARAAHPDSTRPAGTVQPSYEVPFVPEMPSFIDPEPTDALIVVLALLHASGGALRQQELARAFALWSKPTLLVAVTPAELARKAANWSDRVGQRSIAPGTLVAALEDLVGREVLKRTIDDASHVVVNTTGLTPDESAIDAWFRFEARLVLGVLATVAPERAGDVDAGISGEDRNLLAA